MNGIWILLLLITIAALPAVFAFFWFRSRRFRVTPPWFLASLAAGSVSLFTAVLVQSFFPLLRGQDGPGPMLFNIFVRIALVEEASRLVTLVPLLYLGRRRRTEDRAFGAAAGFAVGLGFAVIESASYGAADIYIALLRAFTAAPLHGACGIRIGAAAFGFRRHPLGSLFFFISAVLIHGAYNLMIVSPVFPSILAALIALAALFSSLPLVKDAGRDDRPSFVSNPPRKLDSF
jgi:RsiW-degrading membrane proteinase PrsW (M82 family)